MRLTLDNDSTYSKEGNGDFIHILGEEESMRILVAEDDPRLGR